MRAWSPAAEQTLRELYAALPLPALCFRLKRTASAIKTRANRLGLCRTDRKPWRAADLRLLRERYPHERTVDVAAALGRPVNTVYQKAIGIGLRKTAAYLASPAACRTNGRQGIGSRFEKGHVPANKGLRRPGWARGRMAETQFKPGQAPTNHKPVGYERVTVDGYRERKVAEPKTFRAVHVLLWEEHLGPVPKGCAVVFKNGNKTDIRIDNLALVSRAELMRRNSYHRYPKEIARVIQLRGALNRQINKREGRA